MRDGGTDEIQPRRAVFPADACKSPVFSASRRRRAARITTLLRRALPLVVLLWPLAGNSDGGAISRVPAVAEPPSDPRVVKQFAESRARGNEPTNLIKVLAQAPAQLHAVETLTFSFRAASTSLPRPLQELAILRGALVARSSYVLARHKGMAVGCGVAPEKIAQLAEWRDSTLFDDKERAVLAYVDAVTASGEVDAETFQRLAGFFDDKQVVELTVLTSGYAMISRVTKSLELKLEDGFDETKPFKCL
jgi:alkylhydroperoxidase family enzyme